MAEFTFTNPAGASAYVTAQGHLLAPGKSFSATLPLVHPRTIKQVDDGELTASPTIPAYVIEAAKAALYEDPRLEQPITSFKEAAVGKTPSVFKTAMAEADRVTQIVFESTNTPQAFGTGVDAVIVARDTNGDDLPSVSALEVEITAAGSGVSSPNAGPFTITADTDNVVTEGDTTTPVTVILRGGRAKVNVQSAGAGELTLGLQNPSRTVTVTDTQVNTLT